MKDDGKAKEDAYGMDYAPGRYAYPAKSAEAIMPDYIRNAMAAKKKPAAPIAAE